MLIIDTAEFKRLVYSLEQANDEYRETFGYASHTEAYRGIDKLGAALRRGYQPTLEDAKMLIDYVPHMVKVTTI